MLFLLTPDTFTASLPASIPRSAPALRAFTASHPVNPVLPNPAVRSIVRPTHFPPGRPRYLQIAANSGKITMHDGLVSNPRLVRYALAGLHRHGLLPHFVPSPSSIRFIVPHLHLQVQKAGRPRPPVSSRACALGGRLGSTAFANRGANPRSWARVGRRPRRPRRTRPRSESRRFRRGIAATAARAGRRGESGGRC